MGLLFLACLRGIERRNWYIDRVGHIFWFLACLRGIESSKLVNTIIIKNLVFSLPKRN